VWILRGLKGWTTIRHSIQARRAGDAGGAINFGLRATPVQEAMRENLQQLGISHIVLDF
jgi:hypothetical protein